MIFLNELFKNLTNILFWDILLTIAFLFISCFPFLWFSLALPHFSFFSHGKSILKITVVGKLKENLFLASTPNGFFLHPLLLLACNGNTMLCFVVEVKGRKTKIRFSTIANKNGLNFRLGI